MPGPHSSQLYSALHYVLGKAIHLPSIILALSTGHLSLCSQRPSENMAVSELVVSQEVHADDEALRHVLQVGEHSSHESDD